MGSCNAKKTPIKSVQKKFAAKRAKMKYHIDKVAIGKGAFSKVYKGYRLNNPNIEVAVKSICKLELWKKDLEAMDDEVHVLKTLDHPKIVKYYDMYEDDIFMFIVTELWKGTTIGQQLKLDKCYSENDVKNICYQLTTALRYCHHNNVWHRDLKPDNIMIDEDLNVTLIDFGLSKLESKNRFKSLVGSPVYMAPEILKGKYSKKCDIWSLGVLMYRMISGWLPYNGDSMEEIQNKKLNSKPNFTRNCWEQISPEWINFIQKCFEVDTKKRCSAQKLLKDEWFNDLNNKINESVSTVIETSRSAVESSVRNERKSEFKNTWLEIVEKFLPNEDSKISTFCGKNLDVKYNTPRSENEILKSSKIKSTMFSLKEKKIRKPKNLKNTDLNSKKDLQKCRTNWNSMK